MSLPLLSRVGLTAGVVLGAFTSSASAHVIIDSPNGGELLTAGETFTLEWHVTIAHTLQNWDVWYSTSGAAGPWIPIAMDLPPGSPTVGVPHYYDWVVPDDPSTQVRVRVLMDNAATDYEDISDADLTIQSGCPTPISYCSTSPNSNGAGALIGWTGTASLGVNDIKLTVTAASSSQPGIFYYGPNQIQLPFGDGFRCVGGGAVGVFRLYPAVMTDGVGDATRALDLTQPPANAGPGMISAGDTWNFQFWYRDPGFGVAGFNLSDGLSISFCD